MVRKPQSSVWNYSKPALCRKTMNSAKMSEPAVRTNVSSFVIATFLIVNLRFTVHIIYHFGKIPSISTSFKYEASFRPKGSRRVSTMRQYLRVVWANKAHYVALLLWFASVQASLPCSDADRPHTAVFASSNWPSPLSCGWARSSFASLLRMKMFVCVCVWQTAGNLCVCVDDLFTTCSLSTTRNSTACRSPLHPLCSWCGCDSSGCFHSSPAMAILSGACVIATTRERIAAFGNKPTLYRNITAILFSFHFLIILLVRPIQEGPDKCTAQWAVQCWGSLGVWMALAWVMLHRVLALFGAASPLAAATAGL